jgi:ABC-type Mn2+/Zn2+ transport system ATPase subunit
MADSPKSTANAVELSEVTFGFSYNRPVVEGINLRIPLGGFVGILGPSGSGKTTILKIIAGLHRPWHGTVSFDGSNAKPVIGYVPQVETVDWTFPVTVREVVSMGIWNKSGRGPWIDSPSTGKIKEILKDLEIGDYLDRHISELSGGEQQRVFLARAMILLPTILILDEPTSGVDYYTRETVLGVLSRLNQSGTTIILTTHDISGMARRLPYVVCMNKRIISEGAPGEVLTNENLMQTYGLLDSAERKQP